MKYLKITLLVLLVSIFIGNGCRKDESVFFQDYQTNLRSDSLYDYYKGFVLPDGSIISRRPTAGEFSCLQDIPNHTWNGLAVIDLIIRYENLKCNAPDSVNAFGTPVWSLTMDSTSNGENITFVPLVDENENLTGLFSVLKSNSKENYLFKQRSVMDSTEIEFLDIIIGKKKDRTSSCDMNFKINKESWKRFWNNLGDFFDSIFGGFDIGGAGSPGGGGGWNGGGIFSGSFSNNGGIITVSGGSSGGGSTSNTTRYLRPFAGYEICDPRLKTVEGCKRFFKDHLGSEISTPDLEDKIKTCGCFSAVLFVDHQEWDSVNDPKQRCLLCDGNAFLNGGYGSIVDKLFNVLNYTEFPCTNVDLNQLDDIQDELLGDICSKVAYDHNYYPGKLYNDYIALLKQMNVDFLTRSNNHAGLDAASNAIISMAALFGMDESEVKNLTNEQICRKLEVADCLLPKFLDDSGFNTGDEEIERDKEIFWEMVQSKYYDACTGAQIDIDDALFELCQQNNLSGSALINELDGVDYITSGDITKHEEIFQIFGITSQSEKAKYLSSDCFENFIPECDNCTASQLLIITEDQRRAQRMLKCAIDKLKDAKNNPNHPVWGELQDYFNSSDSKLIDLLTDVFRWIHLQSNRNTFEIGGNQCDEFTRAYTYPIIFANIHLCNENYFNQNPNDRSEVIIHEMMHVYFLRADLAYRHQTFEYRELTPWQHLLNADSYSEFIKSICS